MKRLFAWVRRVFARPEHKPVLQLPAGEVAPKPEKKPKKKDEPKATPAGRLKPKQLRMALRDPRLMPKPPRKWTADKPPPVIPVAEGVRLFSTLRTTNRDHRTLAADLEQLAHYGLPAWETERDVASALGITVGALRHFSIHRERERVAHYVTYTIPKRSGGLRMIHAPKTRLKAILRKLQRELVSKLPVSEHAHGFVVGRSVRTGAARHINKRVVLRLDLEAFFPTVTAARVRGYLIALGYGYPVAAALAVLATEAERQRVDIDGAIFHVPVGPRTCVQGAPTSPGICNAILGKLDHRIAALAKRAGFDYTRYADDLTLSSDANFDGRGKPPAGSAAGGQRGVIDTAHRLRKQVERVIVEEGFVVNAKKTRVMTKGGAQRVTGVTVNRVIGLSRKERRKIRAMLHRDVPDQRQRVAGLVAWVQMLNPMQAAALIRQAQSTRKARSNSSGFDDA